MKFEQRIREHNQKALANVDHPKPTYREPTLKLIICANAPMAFTTENGIHVIPAGCLRD